MRKIIPNDSNAIFRSTTKCSTFVVLGNFMRSRSSRQLDGVFWSKSLSVGVKQQNNKDTTVARSHPTWLGAPWMNEEISRNMVDDEETQKIAWSYTINSYTNEYRQRSRHVYRTSLFSIALEFQVILNPWLIDWLYAAKREFQRPLFILRGRSEHGDCIAKWRKAIGSPLPTTPSYLTLDVSLFNKRLIPFDKRWMIDTRTSVNHKEKTRKQRTAWRRSTVSPLIGLYNLITL